MLANFDIGTHFTNVAADSHSILPSVDLFTFVFGIQCAFLLFFFTCLLFIWKFELTSIVGENWFVCLLLDKNGNSRIGRIPIRQIFSRNVRCSLFCLSLFPGTHVLVLKEHSFYNRWVFVHVVCMVRSGKCISSHDSDLTCFLVNCLLCSC